LVDRKASVHLVPAAVAIEAGEGETAVPCVRLPAQARADKARTVASSAKQAPLRALRRILTDRPPLLPQPVPVTVIGDGVVSSILKRDAGKDLLEAHVRFPVGDECRGHLNAHGS
jgi:hypothetical protein